MMRTLRPFVCLIVFLWTIESSAQTPFTCVQLPKNGIKSEFHGQTEPSIAIDPNNPEIIAAGCIIDEYFYSTDGGKNWSSYALKSTYGVWGDPVVAFDYDGRVYYFHLADYKKTHWIDRIVCQTASKVNGKMSDGTFPKPNGAKAQDKQWVAVNPINNELYLTWTQFDKYDSKEPQDSSIIMFSKSRDQGKTWSLPKRISYFAGDCIDDDNTVEGAVPALGPNGEIFVTWSGPKGLVMQVSHDGGDTWLSQERIIGAHPGGWTFNIPGINRANGLPVLTSDLSQGPHRGTLYLNWCDQRNGKTDTDVWLATSNDGGNSWSEPIRVNQDSSKRHQFFTWMAVDQSTGYLYFVYYDRRNHADNTTDVYVSVSRDGGRTFQDVRVSDRPFVPKSTVFFGDYLNIAAVNGTIRPIWPRMDEGNISLNVTLIDEATLQNLDVK
jgi:hypothetical protein